ncbi:hypothetical protein NOVO_02825 [Rickettsiales bacterium Ac37b]|nr:hypothetical protein NOVO_02825 [Rickettsiales bacterium Ac37b]
MAVKYENKKLISLSDKAIDIAQKYTNILHKYNIGKISSNKVEEILKKRDDAILSLETPLVIGIARDSVINWKKWIDTYAHILKHSPSSEQTTKNQTDFVQRLQDRNKEFVQLHDNIKNKFFQRSFDFYRTRPGKDKNQKEQKLNEIVSHIAVSITEKAYSISPNLGSIDKLFDETTQKNIDTLLHKEFDRHSSRGAIIKKIEAIIKERAVEYRKENLKSSINIISSQYQKSPTSTIQTDKKQVSDEHIALQNNVKHREVPASSFRENNENKSMTMQNKEYSGIKPIRPAPPLPTISKNSSIAEKRASQSSVSSLQRPTTPPPPPPGVINALSSGKVPPAPPPPLQQQTSSSRANLLDEIHKGKTLKKVDQISGDANWGKKEDIGSQTSSPKTKEAPQGIMGAIAKAIDTRRREMGYNEHNSNITEVEQADWENDKASLQSSGYGSRKSSTSDIPEEIQKRASNIVSDIKKIKSPPEQERPKNEKGPSR